uniref:CSON000333 protein n=1 Tax=Culicoides sonorensis TaxID=179676 RepID=A0A336MED6_CULSO
MSDQPQQGRGTRNNGGRGTRMGGFGRQSDPPVATGRSNVSLTPTESRPPRPLMTGGEGYPSSSSRPVSTIPGVPPAAMAATLSAQQMSPTRQAGPTRVVNPTEVTVITGRAKPTDTAPSATAPSRGNMRGRRVVSDIAHTRPDAVKGSKKGTTGTLFNMKTNYFRIQRKKQWGLYQYRVDFAPDIDVTQIRKALLRQHKSLFNGFLFDGSMLWTTTKLQDDPYTITTKRQDDSPVQIIIKFTKEVTTTEQSSLQVLNVILREAMQHLKLQLVGRNFFDPVAKIDIPEFRLELWPGYITSIRQHETDILMCAEISSKVMRRETLLDILHDCVKNHRDYKEVYTKTIIGSTVLTDYTNKTYRIDDVDWDRNPSSTFETRDGTISFAEYYQKRYHLKIKDLKQPLLMSRSKDRQRRQGQDDLIALIPELCRATGFTDQMRTNFRLMKAVAEHTRVGPAQRVRRLMTFNQRLQGTPESVDVLRQWNMRLSQELVEVTGRELMPERIVFGTREAPGTLEADWTREFRNNKLYNVLPLQNWHIIVPSRARKESQDFIKLLQESVGGMGIQISQPQIHNIESDRNEEVLRAIDDSVRHDPELVMIVVTNNNSSRYAAIKKKCCVDRAVPTQVIVQKTITPKGGNVRGLMSVATKVAIQINCKLGAAPWFIKLPLTGLMVAGFDVFHDTKNKAISYGALVASMDLRENCKYFSAVSPHKNGEELSNELSLNMTKAIKEYRLQHGGLPSKIIIYRDGVGEGQLQYIVDHELKHLVDELNKHYRNAGQESVKLCFVIVNKRLNTRIFNQDKNPNPGTIVDDVITFPERYDFYLISQSVRQGTVSPTSYNIIHDTMSLPPDKLQILTYKMCHLYYNWSGTTRVPAVCQYAHKLAQLVGEHIHQAPNQSMQKQLYFL